MEKEVKEPGDSFGRRMRYIILWVLGIGIFSFIWAYLSVNAPGKAEAREARQQLYLAAKEACDKHFADLASTSTSSARDAVRSAYYLDKLGCDVESRLLGKPPRL